MRPGLGPSQQHHMAKESSHKLGEPSPSLNISVIEWVPQLESLSLGSVNTLMLGVMASSLSMFFVQQEAP